MLPRRVPAPSTSLRIGLFAAIACMVAVVGLVTEGRPISLLWFIPLVDGALVLSLGFVVALSATDVRIRRDSTLLPLAMGGACVAVLWLAHLLTFPTVLPLKLPLVTSQTAAYLFHVAHGSLPVLLIWMLLHRGGPVRRPVATVAGAVAGGLAVGALLAIGIAWMAPALPALVIGDRFGTLNTVLSAMALLPVMMAVALSLAGRRGDLRLEAAILMTLVLLSFESLSYIFVQGRYEATWYLAHTLTLLPALCLLSGMLGLYAAARRESEGQRELVARLQDSERRLTVIVDTSPSAVVTADEAGVITGWNRKAELIFGWTHDEAVGRALTATLIPRRYRRAHERGVERFRETGQGKLFGKTVQMMALHRDGHEFPVEIVVSTTWRSGRQVSFVAFVTDITARWESERLRAAQFAVSRPLATASTWAEAAPPVIRGICDTLGWAHGEFWAVDQASGRLRMDHQWHRPSKDLDEFARVSGTLTPTRGRGLVGRVWAAGRAVAIADISADDDSPLAEAARPPGLRGAFAFATMNGRQVTGVMAFYRLDARSLDRATLRVLSDIGSQIGQFIERRRAEEALRRSGERMRAVLDNVADGIITVDERSAVRTINPAAQRLFGYSADEVVGTDVIEMIDENQRAELRVRLTAYLQDGEPMGLAFHETVGRRSDGTTFPLEFVATRMESQRLLIGSLRDISDRKAETEALQYQAMHDALTGLANRTFLRERVEQAVRAGERENLPGGILMLDLDGFKAINDAFGHAAGDTVLKEVARRIRGVLRKVDTVARLGGDEFAVVPFGTTDVARGIVIADKISQALRAPMVLDGQDVEVTASIGIAIHPQHGEDADALLRHADVAMYAAKRARSGYCVYLEEQEAEAGARQPLIGKLGHAIQQFELQAHYQPLVDVRSRRVTKVEALVRWGHPRHGLLPPDDFIPAAEQTDLIKPLTAWVLNEALGQLHAWQRTGLELGMSVNLSARNLLDDELPETVSELLQTWQVAPERLTLEITERSILAAAADATITRLRATGVRLSVDDFGTGYSSLAYLKRLPLDEIKIDRSFLADVVTNRDDAAIVRSTIDLAHNLGLTVVGEGVENAETWGMLAQHGCDLLQGYYVSRPLPAPDLAAWLREWQRMPEISSFAG